MARSEAGKFGILETKSCNFVNTFRRKFNKGDENKLSVLQAQPTQLCIMEDGKDDTGHAPGQTLKGIYPTTTLCDSAYLDSL